MPLWSPGLWVGLFENEEPPPEHVVVLGNQRDLHPEDVPPARARGRTSKATAGNRQGSRAWEDVNNRMLRRCTRNSGGPGCPGGLELRSLEKPRVLVRGRLPPALRGEGLRADGPQSDLDATRSVSTGSNG